MAKEIGSIHSRNVGTTSCKNVETLPRKNNLSRFKSLLVTGLWDITLTSLLPPIQSCSFKFWAWSYIVSNFAKGWRGDHKHKIMERPLIPKYGTPFPCANSTRACSDHLTFTELTLLAKPKVFIKRKVGPPSRVTQPSQKDDHARRVTLLDKPTFLFLMSTVRQVLQENVRKVGWTRVAGIGGWPIYLRRWNMTVRVSIVLNRTPL